MRCNDVTYHKNGFIEFRTNHALTAIGMLELTSTNIEANFNDVAGHFQLPIMVSPKRARGLDEAGQTPAACHGVERRALVQLRRQRPRRGEDRSTRPDPIG
jgi:hypothetical protein